MGKVGNAIMMLNILSSGKKFTVKELADLIEVTPRMIRSYKDDLEKAGIYIESVVGTNGGYTYKNKENFGFNFSITDLRELENLKSELDQYRNFSRKKLLNLDSIIEKLRTIVVMQKYSNQAMYNRYDKQVEQIEKAINAESTITLSLGRNKMVSFKPLHINFYKENLFVTGYVYDYESMRTYSINEIKEIL